MFTTFFSTLGVRILFTLVTSFLVALVIGPRVIDNLKLRQIGQNIREEGVASHKKKAGIPTMGGMIILVPALLTVILWVKFNAYVLFTLLAIVGTGFLGMMDDLTKVLKARSLGLTPRQKLAGQIILGLVIGLGLRFLSDLRFESLLNPGSGSPFFAIPATSVQVPWYGPLDFGFLYLPFVVVVFVAATNAVNLTDGLDGLAAGSVSIALVPFFLIALISGNSLWARQLGVLHIPGAEELTIICGALLGGCLGFLWYNAHPAEVFMGDMGSLALGGAFGALAICTKTELFLVIIGGLFVMETLSVIVQVSYFKYTHGQRVFRMSPIHHHFELCGWAEEKVVIRFWTVAFFCAALGFVLFSWQWFR